MLQNLEKSGYNRLSRRQVLQILGVSMGALAVGGCTGKLLEHGLSSNSKLEPLAASTSSLFWRTIQASENLDKEYLRERSRKLKRIVKQLKKGQGNPAELASEARQAGYEIVGHWAERGVLRALDEDLKEILTITPESLVLPLPETKAMVKQLQLELRVSDDEIRGWEREYSWDKGKLLKAIRQEGSEMLWLRWLAKTFSQARPYSKSSLFIPLDGGLALLLLLGALLLLTGCDSGPDITRYVPPVALSSKGGGCFLKGTLVTTKQGKTPIERIQTGDNIYVFDLTLDNVAVRQVVKTFAVWAEEFLLLDFGTEEICCTPLHRFYTGQWVHAKDLSRRDRVLSLDGRWKELKATRREVMPQLAFNLHVDGIHNYFVGQSGLLVHNSKDLRFTEQARGLCEVED